MDIIMQIVQLVAKICAGVEQAKQSKRHSTAAPNPMADLLAQQQAAEAANCQMLMEMMAQQQAQQAVMMQQMMGW
jgi:hypothetical protein